MALVTLNFESRCLGNNTAVSVILPDLPRQMEPRDF